MSKMSIDFCDGNKVTIAHSAQEPLLNASAISLPDRDQGLEDAKSSVDFSISNFHRKGCWGAGRVSVPG